MCDCHAVYGMFGGIWMSVLETSLNCFPDSSVCIGITESETEMKGI